MKRDFIDHFNFSEPPWVPGLKMARDACGKTIKEVSQSMGISAKRLHSYEEGKLSPSLPELESLSFLYNVPLAALFDAQMITEYLHDPQSQSLQNLMQIRHHFIGTHLQLARENLGKTINELAREIKISASRLKKYERGELAIPLDDLQKLCQAVNRKILDILDKESPIGMWQEFNSQISNLKEISQENREFFLSRENQPYLDLARQMKTIGRDQFASLSESLQKILDLPK